MPLPLTQPALPAPELPSTPAEIEILIGQVTATAVGALAAAVREWHLDGNAHPDTMATEADWIAQLVELKQATVGEVSDFDTVARQHGLRLLQAHCGDHVSAGLLAMLVDDVLR